VDVFREENYYFLPNLRDYKTPEEPLASTLLLISMPAEFGNHRLAAAVEYYDLHKVFVQVEV
jgi:hypothetical protein